MISIRAVIDVLMENLNNSNKDDSINITGLSSHFSILTPSSFPYFQTTLLAEEAKTLLLMHSIR